MAEYAADLGLVADALVPVPLHRARERQRGYNQSRLLAREMSASLDWPVVEALARLRNTPAQVGLNRAQRLANVRDAFCVTDASVAGRRVLLIDDVCTTGATLGACSQALRRAGARSVWALTLARAVDLPAKPQP
jgi:ComF family protein